MNIETIRPPCSICYDACPCRHWETLKVLNELNQAQAKIRTLEKKIAEMEKQRIELVKAVSHQVELDT